MSWLAPRTAQAAELSPAQKLEMKQLYERATRAYDVAKYAEAIEFYQKAYEIGGDPPMLYNIAQSYRLNDQPADAVRFYRRYLQRAPNARNKDDVERKIADLEKIVEERRKAQAAAPPPSPPPATTVPPPAPIAGPPAPVQPTPPPAMLDATGATGTGEAAPPPVADGDAGSGQGRKIVGWSLIGVGGAAAVGAVIAGLIAKSNSDKVTSASQSHAEFDERWESTGKAWNKGMIGLAIGAGAAATAGVILVLTAPSASSSPPSSAPAEAAPPEAARATVTPWLAAGVFGAGATLRF